jgi:5-methyltetrahydropteroyltriglutamate--homocysteine methyltransferase
VGTPYRAEVVGSLLRPSYLLQAREAWSNGTLSDKGFKQVEDRAVDQAIALQEGAGLDVITDGEMRRLVYFDQFIMGLTGLIDAPGTDVHFHAEDPSQDVDVNPRRCVAERIGVKRMLTPEEWVYSRARARRPVKVTLPSPLMLFTLWSPEHSPAAYSDPFELFADGVEIVRQEARELASLGCEYIQIDAPELIQVLADESQHAEWRALGIEPERVFSEGVELVNAVADVPGVQFGLHLCRGNHQSQWIAEGGYERASTELFPRATNFDAFMLEYDDARSGGFEPLKSLPDDKTVVLGLVSTKRDAVEDVATITSRIDEAAKYVSRDQLALSTQCGFASSFEGNRISERTQAAKLKLIADVAHDAWG